MLLLESAEQSGSRNARTVKAAGIKCLNCVQKRYPEASPKDARSILQNIGQSQMTHEQTKKALSLLKQTEKGIKRKYQEDKKREEENHWILAQFNMVDDEKPVFTKHQRMG